MVIGDEVRTLLTPDRAKRRKKEKNDECFFQVAFPDLDATRLHLSHLDPSHTFPGRQSSRAFSVSGCLQPDATDSGCRRSTLPAVAAHFESADHDMEPAVPLDLAFQAIEQVALKLSDLAAAQAGHVDVIALRPAFVVMLFSLQMHQIQL